VTCYSQTATTPSQSRVIGISSNVTLDVDCDCLDVDICVNVVLVNLDVVVLGMSDGTVLVVTFSVAIAVFDICDIVKVALKRHNLT
jgi:hypothetical protein